MNDDEDIFAAGYAEDDDMADGPAPIDVQPTEVVDRQVSPSMQDDSRDDDDGTRKRGINLKGARVRPLSPKMSRKGIAMVLVVRNDGKTILYTGSNGKR